MSFAPGQKLSAIELNRRFAEVSGAVGAVTSVNGATGPVTVTSANANHVPSNAGGVARPLRDAIERLGLHVDDFGAVGDGTTDDSAAIQAALDACAAAGGGTVLLGAKQYRAPAGLLVPRGVTLRGGDANWQQDAELLTDWASVPYALRVPSTATVRMRNFAHLRGVAVIRDGLVSPTTVREAMDAIASFAGTAIRIGDDRGTASPSVANDCSIRDCLIVGFAQGFDVVRGARFWGENILGDVTGGCYADQCFDIIRWIGIHWIGLVNSRSLSGAQTFAITGWSDNGSGKARLTLASAHPFVSGEYAQVYGATGGFVAGRYQVTVVNSTTLDLLDVSAGAFSGGTVNVYLSWRNGTAFELTALCDGPYVTHCFEYGHALGFDIAADFCKGSILESDALGGVGDQGVAFRLRNVGQYFGLQGHSKTRHLEIDSGASAFSSNIVGSTLANPRIISGSATISGSTVRGTVTVEDTARSLGIVNCDTVGLLYSASAAARQKVFTVGDRRSGTPLETNYSAPKHTFRTVDASGVEAARFTIDPGGATLEGTLDVDGLGVSEFDSLITFNAGADVVGNFSTEDGTFTVGRRSSSAGAQIVLQDSTGANASTVTTTGTEMFLLGPGAQGNVIVGGSATTARQNLILRGFRSAPADGQQISAVVFRGADSASTNTDYAAVEAVAVAVANGAEQGSLRFYSRDSSDVAPALRWTIEPNGTLSHVGGGTIGASGSALVISSLTVSSTLQANGGATISGNFATADGTFTVGRRNSSQGAQVLLQDNTGANASQFVTDTGEAFILGPGAQGPVNLGPGTGASGAFVLRLRGGRASPAANDVVSQVTARGLDSAAQVTDYASIAFRSVSVTDGAEQGDIRFLTLNGGSLAARWTMRPDGTWEHSSGVIRGVGSGSPEGVVAAPVGSTWHRTDGGAGTSFYVKESGTGNTGWVAK